MEQIKLCRVIKFTCEPTFNKLLMLWRIGFLCQQTPTFLIILPSPSYYVWRELRVRQGSKCRSTLKCMKQPFMGSPCLMKLESYLWKVGVLLAIGGDNRNGRLFGQREGKLEKLEIGGCFRSENYHYLYHFYDYD